MEHVGSTSRVLSRGARILPVLPGTCLCDPMILRMHIASLVFVPDVEDIQLCYAGGDDRRYD